MATAAARKQLLRNGKLFPLNLLRGSVSRTSTSINLDSKFGADLRFQPQVPISVQYFRGIDSAVAANGYNMHLLYTRFGEKNGLNVLAKSFSRDDDDNDSDFDEVGDYYDDSDDSDGDADDFLGLADDEDVSDDERD